MKGCLPDQNDARARNDLHRHQHTRSRSFGDEAEGVSACSRVGNCRLNVQCRWRASRRRVGAVRELGFCEASGAHTVVALYSDVETVEPWMGRLVPDPLGFRETAQNRSSEEFSCKGQNNV